MYLLATGTHRVKIVAVAVKAGVTQVTMAAALVGTAQAARVGPQVGVRGAPAAQAKGTRHTAK